MASSTLVFGGSSGSSAGPPQVPRALTNEEVTTFIREGRIMDPGLNSVQLDNGNTGIHPNTLFKSGWENFSGGLDGVENVQPVKIEGTIPSELSGVLYRNGPGGCEVWGNGLQHPLDGNGLYCNANVCF